MERSDSACSASRALEGGRHPHGAELGDRDLDVFPGLVPILREVPEQQIGEPESRECGLRAEAGLGGHRQGSAVALARLPVLTEQRRRLPEGASGCSGR